MFGLITILAQLSASDITMKWHAPLEKMQDGTMSINRCDMAEIAVVSATPAESDVTGEKSGPITFIALEISNELTHEVEFSRINSVEASAQRTDIYRITIKPSISEIDDLRIKLCKYLSGLPGNEKIEYPDQKINAIAIIFYLNMKQNGVGKFRITASRRGVKIIGSLNMTVESGGDDSIDIFIRQQKLNAEKP